MTDGVILPKNKGRLVNKNYAEFFFTCALLSKTRLRKIESIVMFYFYSRILLFRLIATHIHLVGIGLHFLICISWDLYHTDE